MLSEVLATFNSPGGRWLPTSRLIAPTAPGKRESFDGTSTGSEEEKQTLVEDTASLPKATFAPLSELSEGKWSPKLLLPPSDVIILSTFPVDEGAVSALVVPDATVVGPLAIAGTELQMVHSYVA